MGVYPTLALHILCALNAKVAIWNMFIGGLVAITAPAAADSSASFR
jgi:hypothetical protein